MRKARHGENIAAIGSENQVTGAGAGVEEREEKVVITKNGRPAAVLVNVQEYARLKETLDVLSDPAIMSQLAKSQVFYKSGKKGLSFEDVFGEPIAPAKKRRSA